MLLWPFTAVNALYATFFCRLLLMLAFSTGTALSSLSYKLLKNSGRFAFRFLKVIEEGGSGLLF